MEVRLLRSLRWHTRPGGGRGHVRQGRGAWWRGILHRRVHPGGGAPILQHHLLELQLAVAHLQDGFEQWAEVQGVAHRCCRGMIGPPRCCTRGLSGTIGWADAGIKRDGLDGVWACRPSCFVSWIRVLLCVCSMGCSSPECGRWHARGTRRLWELTDGFQYASVPAKVAKCCRRG